jgi:LPXTG-motif cell wall-anchored protein
VRHEILLTVRTFAADSSRVLLPALTAEVGLPGEATPRRVRSAPLALGVERISAAAEARGDTVDLRPLKGVIELPLGWPRWPFYVLLGLLAIALAAFLWRRRRKPDARPAIIDPRPCDAIALEALAELRQAGLARRGDLMAHYVRLTDIVRPYLERRYGFPAVDLTSSEILAAVAPVLRDDEPDRAADLARELERLLSAADLVKFAKHRPASALAEGELDRAAEFVRATALRRLPPAGPAPPAVPPPPPPAAAPLPPPPPRRVAGVVR